MFRFVSVSAHSSARENEKFEHKHVGCLLLVPPPCPSAPLKSRTASWRKRDKL